MLLQYQGQQLTVFGHLRKNASGGQWQLDMGQLKGIFVFDSLPR
jgi:hypothetical protein